MNYRDFQKTLREHVSFNLVEKTDFLNNVQMYHQPEISKSQFRHPWRKFAIGLAGLALVALLSLGLVFQFDTMASITIDVNPSLEININRLNRVTSVEPLNPDGITIVDNLRYDSGSLEKVLNEIKYQNIVLGYGTEDSLTMLFGVSADDYDTENKLKAKILSCYSENDITVLVLNKHSEVPSSIYSGYAFVIADSETPEYISTTAATMPATTAATMPGTTTAYNDSTTNDGTGVITDSYKMQLSAALVLSEEEYVNLAQTLGITDAKLQVVLRVFLYYSQYVHESDLDLLAEMDLSELLNLYTVTINP